MRASSPLLACGRQSASLLMSGCSIAANPDQPGKPSVEYIHGQSKLVVTFLAPALARSYTFKVRRIFNAAPCVQCHSKSFFLSFFSESLEI